jgi:hypothetical protein
MHFCCTFIEVELFELLEERHFPFPMLLHEVYTPKIEFKTAASLGGSNVWHHVLVVTEFSLVILCPTRTFLHVRLQEENHGRTGRICWTSRSIRIYMYPLNSRKMWVIRVFSRGGVMRLNLCLLVMYRLV